MLRERQEEGEGEGTRRFLVSRVTGLVVLTSKPSAVQTTAVRCSVAAATLTQRFVAL